MSYASEVLVDSPLLYLQFSETAGATCANSGSLGGNGTAAGTYTRNIAGATGTGVGISFGGTTADIVTYPDIASLDITGNVTYECWLKASSFAATQCMMSKGNDTYALLVNTARKVIAQHSFVGARVTSTGAIPNDGGWHHIAFTRNSNTYIVYIDGIADGTAADAVPMNPNALAFQIGRETDGSSHYNPILGSIDEVAVYNTPLSAARLLAHYNAGITAASAFVPQIQAVY